ncbi:MAG: hypothetical protein ACREON_05755 [Gemmatimonadaceae bacterium]
MRRGGKILTTQVEIPAEELAEGPWGYRVHIIDYDASSDTLYKPIRYPPPTATEYKDPFAETDDAALLADPRFHAQNVYAIVMRTLARFEQALGRRISWGFYGHQLKVAPHAFGDANAFYSEHDQSLLFGYFPGRRGTVFTCLSHDIVVHETTHALVDGLRPRFTDPSSEDQAAFHEGFADVVALLSVFSLRDVVAEVLRGRRLRGRNVIARSELTPPKLRKSVLFGLADEMGSELSLVRGQPLRQSAMLEPSPEHLTKAEFALPHRRGELLVAAMMNAFIEVWSARLEDLGVVAGGGLDLDRVVEDGADAADYLLTMSVRALDYTPPVHIRFGDFVTALLTADYELRPDDSRYGYREHLRRSFKAYGIYPATWGRSTRSKSASSRRWRRKTFRKLPEPGLWDPCNSLAFTQDRTHFEPMMRDPDEVFRFIWENRAALRLYEDAYSRVLSVRPCLRVGPDGFALHETVAEFIQILTLQARELKALRIAVPPGMPPSTEVTLYGGGTCIFDEYGRLKFYIHNSLDRPERQGARLAHLWASGVFDPDRRGVASFADLHRARAAGTMTDPREEW